MTVHHLAPTLIRASAGSGKTYQLTGRLLRILLQGSSPESILATTFTRKAAGQILTRLLLDLAAAGDPNDEQGLQQLRRQLDIPTLSAETCLQVFQRLFRNIHTVRICTLDSFFAQLARSFSFELGLPPRWRPADEIEEFRFRSAAIAALIRSAEPHKLATLMAMLGKGEVRRSVVADLDRVISEAYAQSRGCDAEVWSKLNVNRSPDAAALASAIAAMESAQPRQRSLQSNLQKMAAALEHDELDSLTEETLVANIAKARRTHSPVKFGRSEFPPGLDEAFDTLYAAVRSRCLALLRAQNLATADVLQAYEQAIDELKGAAAAFGFDDVAQRLAARFATLDFADLDRRLDARIDHVLLDEFQDTAPVQWQVLRPLAVRAAAAESPAEDAIMPRTFFCVGDAKQAIYGWRGGAAEILDAVVDELPQVREQPLHKSWRSSPVVIEFVNQVFSRIHQHPIYADGDPANPCDADGQAGNALRRFANRFPRHQTAKTRLPGYVRLETASQWPDDESEDPRFRRAAELAAQIHRSAPDQQVAILTRTNAGVASAMVSLERELHGLQVDVSQEGGNPLTDSPAVQIVLSALMLSEHPGDGRWQFHVGASPLRHIAGLDSSQLRRRITDQGLAETIEFLGDALAPVCDPRDTVRLRQLVQLAINYERHAGPRVRDFVDLVRQKRVERPQSASIRAMTVHQAKGLEFDAVILPELEGTLAQIDGRCVPQLQHTAAPPVALSRYLGSRQRHFLPQSWQTAFAQRVEAAMTESICLLYVALTRARQAIHLVITPANRMEFLNKHAAALLFHALDRPGDPTAAETTLYELGDPNWYHGDHV